MARPSPVPGTRRLRAGSPRWNRSKTSSRSAAGTPEPSSSTSRIDLLSDDLHPQLDSGPRVRVRRCRAGSARSGAARRRWPGPDLQTPVWCRRSCAVAFRARVASSRTTASRSTAVARTGGPSSAVASTSRSSTSRSISRRRAQHVAAQHLGVDRAGRLAGRAPARRAASRVGPAGRGRRLPPSGCCRCSGLPRPGQHAVHGRGQPSDLVAPAVVGDPAVRAGRGRWHRPPRGSGPAGRAPAQHQPHQNPSATTHQRSSDDEGAPRAPVASCTASRLEPTTTVTRPPGDRPVLDPDPVGLGLVVVGRLDGAPLARRRVRPASTIGALPWMLGEAARTVPSAAITCATPSSLTLRRTCGRSPAAAWSSRSRARERRQVVVACCQVRSRVDHQQAGASRRAPPRTAAWPAAVARVRSGSAGMLSPLADSR